MKVLFAVLLLVWFTTTNAQIINTIAGNGTAGFSGDGGPAINAQFHTPAGVATDRLGNVYVVDDVNDVIRKIDTNGVITRFAGTGSFGFSADGTLATNASLQLNFGAVGIAVDAVGNVCFAEGTMVRMVNVLGIVSTVAGINDHGNSGDGGPATAAKLGIPAGLCFNSKGDLFIADGYNNNIRMVNAASIISTIAGTGSGGYSGDGGQATSAQLSQPTGIACDGVGDLYLADTYNYRIRKVDTAGVITTIAGDGPTSMGPKICNACPATAISLFAPMGVASDPLGNIYFSDGISDLVYKIVADAHAIDVAGNGTQGYSGDGAAATASELNAPIMIGFDNSGNLLIADKHNYRFRKVWLNPASIRTVKSGTPKLSIYPNPVTHHTFTCTLTDTIDEDVAIEVVNILGQRVCSTTIKTNTPAEIALSTPPGVYFITVIAHDYSVNKKLVVE